jgi:hypothetical protein
MRAISSPLVEVISIEDCSPLLLCFLSDSAVMCSHLYLYTPIGIDSYLSYLVVVIAEKKAIVVLLTYG